MKSPLLYPSIAFLVFESVVVSSNWSSFAVQTLPTLVFGLGVLPKSKLLLPILIFFVRFISL